MINTKPGKCWHCHSLIEHGNDTDFCYDPACVEKRRELSRSLELPYLIEQAEAEVRAWLSEAGIDGAETIVKYISQLIDLKIEERLAR